MGVLNEKRCKWTSNTTGTAVIDFYTAQLAIGHDSYCIILTN
uniref:Uncharacterized protein n=1 Tax=viral metagenome TaxID=1070528 RepID=A0A6C0JY86_9ZZZZ